MRITNEPIAKQMLGSRVKRRILSFLLSKQEPVSERELSRIIGVSHTAVNKAMKQLLELNVVRGKTIGVAMVWELNEKSFAYPYVKALVEASTITPLDQIKKSIKSDIIFMNEINNLVRRNLRAHGGLQFRNKSKPMPIITGVYLFGSVAEGTATTTSDIDVLIIVEFKEDMLGEMLNKSIGEKILEQTGNQVSFHIYSAEDVEKNHPQWLKEAIEKGTQVL
jgi:predicted nucleotidyltransferase/DNA-binding transcriptional regulator YhcF (GntR family)